MPSIDRRAFLVRTGLALGATVFAGALPRAVADQPSPQGKFESWDAVRTQFPLSRHLIHLAGFFLASHPTPVREAIERHRTGLDADPIGYWFEQEEKQEANVLRAAADYLGVDPSDIALTDSTTMGLGLLYGGLQLREGQEILTTTHDHYSTEISLRLRAERTGARVRQIRLYDSLKGVSRDELVDSLREGITPATRIVAVTWVHSSTGLKLPIQEMALAIQSINRSRGKQDRVIFCMDGVHALGVEDFRLSELGCDFLIAGTHKWMFGPRGTGLVWGHQRAWPVAQATIPTFNIQAYDMWMKLVPEKPLPQSIYITPGGFHSFEHRCVVPRGQRGVGLRWLGGGRGRGPSAWRLAKLFQKDKKVTIDWRVLYLACSYLSRSHACDGTFWLGGRIRSARHSLRLRSLSHQM